MTKSGKRSGDASYIGLHSRHCFCPFNRSPKGRCPDHSGGIIYSNRLVSPLSPLKGMRGGDKRGAIGLFCPIL